MLPQSCKTSAPKQIVNFQALITAHKFSHTKKFLSALVASRPLVEAVLNQLNCARQGSRSEVCIIHYELGLFFKVAFTPQVLQRTKPDTNPEETANAINRAKLPIEILTKMSECPEGLRQVVQSGGLACMANCISCPVDRVSFYAITNLNTILRMVVQTDLR